MRRLIELQIDHPVTAQRSEVVRIALHHLVAVGERLLILAQEVIDRRPLVPPFGELRTTLDDLGEGLHGELAPTSAHLLDADGEEAVDVRVAGSAPELPHRVLGERTDELVCVAQRRGERRQVGHQAGLSEGQDAAAAIVGVTGIGQRGERLLPRRPGRKGRGRASHGEDDAERQQHGPAGGHGV